ncbi:retrovirus-related pol polyprotein from transposon RE1 [Citrus sinensis]|nr:retrovirus-related pol polyprotein from transposon RE1 [Citrus sinensis]
MNTPNGPTSTTFHSQSHDSREPTSMHNPNIPLSIASSPTQPSPPNSNTHEPMQVCDIPLVNDQSLPTTTPETLSNSSIHESLPGNNSSHPTENTNTPHPSHPMQTRSKNNIFRPKTIFTLTATKHPIPLSLEPTSVSQALKQKEWTNAMREELHALAKNGTWDLVPRESHHNVVGCKWVFRIKRNPDGSVARYKARLVAKGFNQRPGLDYTETFSPVIKPTTIRVGLSIAISSGWPINQLDVNNAFLHGHLDEEVFMSQPPGFIDPSRPHHVCRLQKSLYGLKQAPCAWFTELKNFILSQGFVNCHSDSSLFVYTNKSIRVYFLVYVDDLLITGNSMTLIRHVITALSHKFSIKDLGPLNFFLGVEVIPTSNGLFLSQQKYIRDLLARFNMESIKETATPLSSTTHLILNDGSPPVDASRYRSLIGGMQYLSLTRPDVSYAINKLAQYMHSPRQAHWTAAKRLLRYLKHIVTYGLYLHRHRQLTLTAYSDSDWAGNRDDCTSISAYIIFLGGNPISWCSKKQRTVARSSTEAEYRSVASAVAELTWITNLLSELRLQLPLPPRLLCDNIGATYLCVNPVFHSRMKHLALDYHFVREKVSAGSLQVAHVSTNDQLADVLTKPLVKSRFALLRSKIGVTDGTILRGHKRTESVSSLN